MEHNEKTVPLFSALASVTFITPSLASPGGTGCIFGVPPGNGCTTARRSSESNGMDPPRVDPTTASQTIRELDPQFIHRNGLD